MKQLSAKTQRAIRIAQCDCGGFTGRKIAANLRRALERLKLENDGDYTIYAPDQAYDMTWRAVYATCFLQDRQTAVVLSCRASGVDIRLAGKMPGHTWMPMKGRRRAQTIIRALREYAALTLMNS